MTNRPSPEDQTPTYDDSASPYVLTFADGSYLTADSPAYEARGQLSARIEAWGGEQRLNAGQVNLRSDRDRDDFARNCARMNGTVEVAWLPRLQLLLHNVEGTLERHAPPRRTLPRLLPFPLEALPAPLRAYIAMGASSLPCPPDMIGVPMLSVCGAAMGEQVRLQLKAGWRESGALWSGVIAETGTKKSPALHLAAQPLYQVQEEWQATYRAEMEQYAADLATYEAEWATWKSTPPRDRGPRPDKPEMPAYRQLYCTDATMEALAAALEQNPRGVLFLRDELAAWAKAMNQYKNGKGADREHWLSFWNGSPVLINRKSRRDGLYLAHPFVSVTGTMPPGVLRALTEGDEREDGFTHRILFSMPEATTAGWSEKEITPAVQERYVQIVKGLLTLAPTTLTLTSAARQAWIAWVNAHVREMECPDFDQAWRGPWAKMEGLCARLALVLHMTAFVAQDEDGPTISGLQVSLESMQAAMMLIAYFKSHATHVYQRLGASPDEQRLERAAAWIARHGRQAAPRALYTNNVADCKTLKDAQSLIQTLIAHGYGIFQERPREKGGHPTKLFVLHAR